MKSDDMSGRSELDSHTNMIVVGQDYWVISCSKRSDDVNIFDKDVEALKIAPIVDALLTYDCKRTLKSYLLVVRNVLYIKSILYNLILSFIM